MLLIIITFIIIFYILTDLIPIYRNKQWGLFWTYIVMMALVYVISGLITLGIKLPGPVVFLENAIIAIFGVNPE